jgi:hypothetical protein
MRQRRGGIRWDNEGEGTEETTQRIGKREIRTEREGVVGVGVEKLEYPVAALGVGDADDQRAPRQIQMAEQVQSVRIRRHHLRPLQARLTAALPLNSVLLDGVRMWDYVHLWEGPAVVGWGLLQRRRRRITSVQMQS